MSLRGEDALILAMDYTEQTLKGQGALKGEDGFSPVITENTNTGDVYKLDIETKDGKFTTPNLMGGGDGSHITLRQAEYDALSEEEQSDRGK